MPTGWNWSYSGYGYNTSSAIWATTQNTTYTFTRGNFSIRHGVSNTFGSNISTQKTWVNVSPIPGNPITSFTGVNTSGNAAKVVTSTLIEGITENVFWIQFTDMSV